MPVLHEDGLVTRVDPALNRDAKRLLIRRISVEAGCDDIPMARARREAIAGLASFLGAGTIDYDGEVPSRCRRTLSA